MHRELTGTRAFSPLEALAMLGELGDVTQASLAPIAAQPDERGSRADGSGVVRAVSEVVAPEAVAPPPALPPTPIAYVSDRPEYQSAIRDRQLIDALLKRFGAAPAPEPTPPQPEAAPKVEAPQGFSTPALPEIEASPKPTPLLARRAGMSGAILR